MKRHWFYKRRPQWNFLDTLPLIPYENTTRRRRRPILGVDVLKLNPEEEVVVGRHVLRARGTTDMGMGRARLVDPRILPTTRALTLTPMRPEVAPEAEPVYLGMLEDMDIDRVEDIMGVIDLVASRCPAVARSRNETGKSIFDLGYTKYCITLPSSMPSVGSLWKDWSRISTRSTLRKCVPCGITPTMRSSAKSSKSSNNRISASRL